MNKTNGNPATVYYNEDGSYVVRDDVTGYVVQMSKRGDKNWIPDRDIENPFFPKK